MFRRFKPASVFFSALRNPVPRRHLLKSYINHAKFSSFAKHLNTMPRLNAKVEYEKYQANSQKYWNDGREDKLLEWINTHPNRSQMSNNPEAVLNAINEFTKTESYLIIIGSHKGDMVTDLISQTQPKVMVEMGAYVGYSAIMFGNAVRKAAGNDAKYYSLEINPKFAAITEELVKLAGLDKTVQVVVGGAGDGIEKLHADGLSKIDLLFLDHMEALYPQDLKLCEELGVIDVGSTIVADNCIWPGAPAYVSYIQMSPADKKREFEKAKAAGSDNLAGRPELGYENTTLEPEHGLELSRCVAVDA